MKCQIIFSRKNKIKKKNTSKCRLLKVLPSMQRVWPLKWCHYYSCITQPERHFTTSQNYVYKILLAGISF